MKNLNTVLKRGVDFLLLTLFCCSCSHGQDFGVDPKNIDYVKEATVKIIVNGGESVGTGFIIEGGKVVTCLHVVPAAFTNPQSVVLAKFKNGETVKLKPSPLKDIPGNVDSMNVYDFYVLEFLSTPKTKYKTLKLGSWSDVKEGNLTMTCGYPLAIEQQIVSVGILSTKYERPLSFNYSNAALGTYKTDRKEAWLDLTMNNGNSGGAIIKIGKTPEEDVVVGIADYKLNPYTNTADSLIQIINAAKVNGSVQIMGIDPNESSLLFAKAVKTMSLGVSGCVSIDYLKAILKSK